MLPPFRYRSFGDLATIGRRAAVVNFGYLRLKGFVGWLFWSLVHIYFLIGVKNRFIVAFTWLWDYLTFHRGARLITEVPRTGRKTVEAHGVGLARHAADRCAVGTKRAVASGSDAEVGAADVITIR